MTPRNRIGHGYDVHRLVHGRPLRLGGIDIPYASGLEAHSDGDCLLHAIASALLGAIGAGDLGSHFPDTDERWGGADSADLVSAVVEQVRSRGYGVGNVDSTVLAEAPRLSAHRQTMILRIAALLGVPPGDVNVKFGTGEQAGAVGRGEVIEAYAVVLLTAIDG
ncbi:MAG: 2-C-methyl-D-erythritol 2,4-cyclodiphosphate synthase [Candidatus Binatota bacterium]|jgi:2-C-methyl-D-erythritol 2,4-cyclodiphosphate synthase|nr:2-C-methyl-D-erythritol 2,4-cyclodiphosphate synthase [Candidatus Binatota bacterium]